MYCKETFRLVKKAAYGEAGRATNKNLTCRRNYKRNSIEIAGSVLFLENKPGLGSARKDSAAGKAAILMRGRCQQRGCLRRERKDCIKGKLGSQRDTFLGGGGGKGESLRSIRRSAAGAKGVNAIH